MVVFYWSVWKKVIIMCVTILRQWWTDYINLGSLLELVWKQRHGLDVIKIQVQGHRSRFPSTCKLLPTQAAVQGDREQQHTNTFRIRYISNIIEKGKKTKTEVYLTTNKQIINTISILYINHRGGVDI